MLTNSKTQKNTESWEMDGLIKFILAAVLSVMPFLVHRLISFGILAVFLLIVTLVFRLELRILLISAASYSIIVLIPYLFGVLMNALAYWLSGNVQFAYQGSYDLFLRLFRLLVIWYVSILYFHTTPMKTVIGLLDKLFTPLKFLGVPVTDYLNVVMCIVLELKETGAVVTKGLGARMRSVMGEDKRRFRINVKGISQIIVSLIVNSFEKIDRIQSFVEKVNPNDLYNYRFKLSKTDVIGVLSFIILTAVIMIFETRYW
ncbi:energy-coupling factor transporter transmembrane component T [Desulfosporosinus sp.]|uniref:energy-coupling factor transporter transmembrane component T n=1 Tax=Desulfosporosinus sp. TaxID=157907 RepID=UPI0025BE292B|nr:energy-coupling factor transporter transmembrane component T [Desulfosporosinus sp.]MBC2728484.1 energy-coupling factor transporter transmembrane protein EcfT [Desulfosporosinus sp.]